MVKKKRQNYPAENGDESTESCDENVNSACPHIAKAIYLTKLKKTLKTVGFEKECAECKASSKTEVSDPDFEEDLTLWMCLRCGSQLCGRARNKHALSHFNKSHSDSHSLAANTTSWAVHCYDCNNEVIASNSKRLSECIKYLKKQAESVASPRSPSPIKLEFEYMFISNSNTGNIVKRVPLTETDSKPDKQKENATAMNLPRVRGLANLRNTCFFNSVIQCLVQTPYLLKVLKEMSEPGEKFVLPGGKLKLKGEGDEVKEVELPPITGQLAEWGNLTQTLVSTLDSLQSGVDYVFNPRELLSALVNKLPQFGGGDQHDAHELLRHLLEAVRSEDLRRYQSVILSSLGMSSKVDPAKVDGEVKQKVKFYGQQASDTMLRPEQVFRGFLVSTLECQECYKQSGRVEYFLDLSLPVAATRPQPPALVRRKTPNEDNINNTEEDNKPSKHQLKKERNAARKAARHHKGGNTANAASKEENVGGETNGAAKEDGKSSSEQSDADIEDNLDELPRQADDLSATTPTVPQTAANFAATYIESPYEPDKTLSLSNTFNGPLLDKEKTDSTPENTNKDKVEFADSSTSTLATPLDSKPLISLENLSNPDSGVASPEATKHNSTETVDNVDSPINGKELGSHSSLSSEINLDLSSPQHNNSSPAKSEFERPVSRRSDIERPPSRRSLTTEYSNEVVTRGISVQGCKNLLEHSGESSYESPLPENKNRDETNNANNYYQNIADDVDELLLEEVKPEKPEEDTRGPPKQFPASPRYVCEEGECSVQSCLSQFTALELLTGNNKVGCENCTEKANGKDGKTVYTNATKRFLVSSPPAILILHLKRFQIGPRCMFRKISKHVDFQTILDLAPFCAMDKLKKLPNVARGQNQLLYSLYGVVEHSGGMHGGHYVAYVKVRPAVGSRDPRWWFLPRSANQPAPDAGPDSDSDLSGYESGEGPASPAEAPPGKWYYVSDSMVSEVSEDKVLSAQAYLLFYERIY